MSKLYFRYGTVDSAKSLNLLAVSHKYTTQGKKVLVLKPATDTRWGLHKIKTRAGLERMADYVICNELAFRLYITQQWGTSCILVDEAQFLTTGVIDILREIASFHNIPVICYGLRTDFRGDMFEGSKRLLEVADSIEEIKTTCNFCEKKAIMNLKMVDGKPSIAGPSVDLGSSEKYVAACWACWYDKLNE